MVKYKIHFFMPNNKKCIMNIIQSILLIFLYFLKTYASYSISFLNKNSKEVLINIKGRYYTC